MAVLIDGVLLSIITFPLLWTVYGDEYPDPEGQLEPAEFLITFVLPAVVTILFWTYKMATPGKMAISAKIVDARTGRKPSTGQFVGRYFSYIISAIPLGLGFIWVAFDGRKQGWHDKLAGTVVVRKRSTGTEDVVFESDP